MIKKVVKKENLISLKIYFDRAKMYLGYINFFILNVVLINSIENTVIKEYIAAYKFILIPSMFVIYMTGLIFIGYLDTKLGLRKEEMRNNAMMNPVISELLFSIKSISSDISQIKDHQQKSSQPERK